MPSKNINVLMSLQDMFSAPMKKVVKTTQDAEKAMKLTQKAVRNFGNACNNSFKSLNSSLLQYSGIAGVVGTALSGAAIKQYATDCMDAANIQLQAETQLDAVLKNVESITARGNNAWKQSSDILKAYASDLQAVGVIGDEVTLAGMSQLATFQMDENQIKTVSAGMLDLAAKMKGCKATGEDLTAIANMIGKAFTGQATALSRVGITMTDEQKQIIKFGDASQRAAVIAEVLAQNVGGVNKAMAATEQGKAQQAMNAYGDVMEEIGKKLLPIRTRLWQAFAGILPQLQEALLPALDQLMARFDELMPSIQDLFLWLGQNIPAAIQTVLEVFAWLGEHMDTIVTVGKILLPILAGLYTGFLAFNIISTVVGLFTAVTTAMSGATTVMAAFNAVMLANPIGLISVAIGVLVGLLVVLYENWDTVKSAIMSAWEAFTSFTDWLGSTVMVVLQPIIDGVRYLADNLSKVSKIKLFGGGSEEHNALGTDYWKGGSTYVNEGNRGELINLPSGSQIVPHDVAMAVAGSGSNVTVNLTIQGNVIGNEAFINEVGESITNKLQLALGNM